MGKKESCRFPGMGQTIFTVLVHPKLFVRGIRCISIIIRKFFFFQYRSALFPRLPVSTVEHILDENIPFNPRFVRIYLDFVAFWIRIAGFLAIRFGKKGRILAAEFIESITGIYLNAFQIYQKNLSTTARPNYKKGRHFRLIHIADPHLMCIPSLHVMLMIISYTSFRRCLAILDKEGKYKELENRVFNGALLITEAVLYIKQHSINCIAASLYAMNRLYPGLFSQADANHFTGALFKKRQASQIPPEYALFYAEPFVKHKDTIILREYIMNLYQSFLETETSDWTYPILQFLKTMPLQKRM